MTVKKTKIVIPGGAGLVGQNLVAHLLNKGFSPTSIYVIDKHKTNLTILKKLHPDVNCIEADLAEKGDWKNTLMVPMLLYNFKLKSEP